MQIGFGVLKKKKEKGFFPISFCVLTAPAPFGSDRAFIF